MEINNPASCWLAAGLSVGEEEEEGGGKKKQPFRLTQWRMLRQGKRARRQAKRRRANTTNRRDSLDIRTQMGWRALNPTTAVCFSKNPPLLSLPVLLFFFFRTLGDKSTKVAADTSDKKHESCSSLLQQKWCSYTPRTFTNRKILHFLDSMLFFLPAWNGMV